MLRKRQLLKTKKHRGNVYNSLSYGAIHITHKSKSLDFPTMPNDCGIPPIPSFFFNIKEKILANKTDFR